MDAEARQSLPDRLVDAAAIHRYFLKRDETNAELHRRPDALAPEVRYSPITIAAERVFGWLQRLAMDEGVELPPVLPGGPNLDLLEEYMPAELAVAFNRWRTEAGF